jgi:hypothetical protein
LGGADGAHVSCRAGPDHNHVVVTHKVSRDEPLLADSE